MSVYIGTPSDFGITPQEICAFYNAHWPRKIVLSDVNFYTWQFIANPSNEGVDECCIAINNNEIIGVMGLNSREFYMSGQSVNGAELTTWVVSERHRNKGPGPAMIEYLKGKYEIMIGMGISQAALPVYLRSGFRYIKSIPRYVHVINWDNIAKYVHAEPLAKKYAQKQLELTTFKTSNFSKLKMNEIFNRYKENKNIFSRKAEDVIWRYDNHPYFKYHHYIVNDSCHVSLRVDKNIDGFVMAHCLDIIGDHSSYEAAISSAIHYAQSEGADAIDFFSTHSTLNAKLDAMGLFSTLDHDFFKFPHLFHPIEIRTPATTSLILWSRNNLHELLDVSRLHITKQDADFDRPTIYGIKNV